MCVCVCNKESVCVVCCRLKSETQTVSELQAELLAVRRQNVELEKQLGRQGLEKTGVLTSQLLSAVQAGCTG